MDKFVLYTIGFFFIIGGVDYILGNKFKLGNKFEEGLKAMGPLAIGMIGIYSLAPIISKGLSSFSVPVCKFLGLDPSIIPASILAVDMGGYKVATKLASSHDIGLFSGIIIASTLGATISFSIPVALGMISSKDQKYFAKGVLIGIVTIPIGCFAGGLWQGISLIPLIKNLTPVAIFSILLGIGLLKATSILMKGFNIFGKIVMTLSITGLLFQGISIIFNIEVLSDMIPLSESTFIVGKIAFILAGAYPMLVVLNKVCKKAFVKIEKLLLINSVSVGGLIGCLASNLIVFGTYNEMNPKGKVICAAFAVSGAFVFGGQLGFISGIAPKMLGGFIISKLVAGIISIIAADMVYNHQNEKIILKEE